MPLEEGTFSVYCWYHITKFYFHRQRVLIIAAGPFQISFWYASSRGLRHVKVAVEALAQ